MDQKALEAVLRGLFDEFRDDVSRSLKHMNERIEWLEREIGEVKTNMSEHAKQDEETFRAIGSHFKTLEKGGELFEETKKQTSMLANILQAGRKNGMWAAMAGAAGTGAAHFFFELYKAWQAAKGH